ncbi:MAG: hypothetical protein NW226_06845 [Microscillaceae bacterium]|nr:hypothetical protein [Microscillaceae bacterium]
MDSLPKDILELQNEYNQEVEKLSRVLVKQFDIRVDLALLRILFRESEDNFPELELNIFEQELAYIELEKVDREIIQFSRNLELMNLKLDTY